VSSSSQFPKIQNLNRVTNDVMLVMSKWMSDTHSDEPRPILLYSIHSTSQIFSRSPSCSDGIQQRSSSYFAAAPSPSHQHPSTTHPSGAALPWLTIIQEQRHAQNHPGTAPCPDAPSFHCQSIMALKQFMALCGVLQPGGHPGSGPVKQAMWLRSRSPSSSQLRGVSVRQVGHPKNAR
jgi:hypothetical protein